MSDLVRDLTTIMKRGGKRAAYRRCSVDSSGTITPSGSWIDFQYRYKSALDLDDQAEEHYGEAGELQAVEPGNQQFGYVVSLSAADKATLDFILDEVGSGKFFQIFVDWGLGSASKKWHAFFPLVYMKKKTKIDFPGRKPDIEIRIMQNETAHTPSALPSWGAGSTGDYATAIDRGVATKET